MNENSAFQLIQSMFIPSITLLIDYKDNSNNAALQY